MSDPWYTNEFEKCFQDIYKGCVGLLEYLNKKGRCYKGVDIFSVNESYCPVGEYDWANNISSIAQYLVQEINSL